MPPFLPQHLELDPRGSDFLNLLRDLGHLDEAALEQLTGMIVATARPGKSVSFAEVRQLASAFLFEREASLRPEARELLQAEWARIFS
ncbi:MAG TPA: hypothetical protein PLA94_02285 [Myxococcota bacterium]|nr:hypothetical protein [Myxococcota bacterium]HND28789.1 hypothetical protein [Myxococcota bacterium]